MNDLYLTDEEIWGEEPTWEEREIERLKKIIEKLEDKNEKLTYELNELKKEGK